MFIHQAGRQRRGRATVIALLAAFGCLAGAILFTPATEWLALPLLIAPQPLQQADAIVVLGAWATASGELNESGLRRSIRAADLYRDHLAPVVAVTGLLSTESGSGSAVDAMAVLLSRLGVPDAALTLDRQSVNTHASAVAMAALAKTNGWNQVLLVTDAAHEVRATKAFSRAGLNGIPVSPASVWDLGGAQPSLRVRRVGILAHEYVGLTYYWLRGWI